MPSVEESKFVGPRRITRYRRVSLPVAFSRTLGIEPGSYVTAARARNDRSAIMIQPCQRCEGVNPRLIDDVRQVTFPAALLDSAGLGVGSLVAFTLSATAIKMFAANRMVGPWPVSGTVR